MGFTIDFVSTVPVAAAGRRGLHSTCCNCWHHGTDCSLQNMLKLCTFELH